MSETIRIRRVAPIDALTRLAETTRALAQHLLIQLDVTIEDEGEDEPWLVIDEGRAVSWVDDHDRLVVDATIDTSDPSVGIFGAYEPRSWHKVRGHEDPVLVTDGGVGADLDAAAALIMLVVESTLQAWISNEHEERTWAEVRKRDPHAGETPGTYTGDDIPF